MTDVPYPKRPPFFACRFVRLMTKKCVANDLGPQVFTLLAVIAHQEDARGYSDPVGWYNPQLLPLVGIKSVDVLDRVRDKAIKAGWLHYTSGTKEVPGRYFVTIPERFKKTDDGATDEGVDEGFEGASFRTSADESRRDQRTEPDSNRGTPIPVPSPVPVAASKPDAAPPSIDRPDHKPALGPAPPTKPRRKGPREKKPRKLNPLFEAIVAATDANRDSDGSNIGRVCANFATFDPPFTPEEVADFAANWRSAFPWAKLDEHPLLTINILGKHANNFRRWRRMNPPRASANTFRPPPKFDTQPPRGVA